MATKTAEKSGNLFWFGINVVLPLAMIAIVFVFSVLKNQ